jgi:iron transport multicopper oxidase
MCREISSRKFFFCLIITISLFLSQINQIESKTFRGKYKISWFEGAPDGVKRQILGMNNNFPPTIRVKKGDKVEFEIENLIKDGITDIHFHGMFQKKTLLSDGVGGVTQCDPLYKEKYLYKFRTEKQVGTYWYHSHSGLQLVDGLKGAFIVDNPNEPFMKPFKYFIAKKYQKIFNQKSAKYSDKLFYVDHSHIDKNKEPDSVIVLTDWYHKLADEINVFFLSPASNGAEPTPESALINQKGNYNCKPPMCESMYDTKIVAGKAKRFRIINASAMAVFHFTIQGHSMHIIETDGVTLDGESKVNVLRLNAGQRYSVIVKADQEFGNYWIRATMDRTIYPEPPAANWQPEVFGVMKYTDPRGKMLCHSLPTEKAYVDMDSLLAESILEGEMNIDMTVPLVPLYAPYPPASPTKRFIFNLNPIVDTKGVNYLAFNNIAYLMNHETTLLGLILNNQPITKTQTINGINFGYNPYVFDKGDVVDLIINNLDGMEHPIHGHGHNFYVMYSGPMNSAGFINDTRAPYTFDYNKNASLRDVASVNGSAVLVLRFVADNPGVWVFHCHNAWHLEAGLMLTLVEDICKIKKLYWRYRSLVTYCRTYEMGAMKGHMSDL